LHLLTNADIRTPIYERQQFKNEPITLTVAQGATRDASVSGRTGVALWNSCLLLTRLLDVLNINSNCKETFKDQTVLELGVGTGAASIAAYKMGAKQVIATDGNPEVVALAQRNIVANIDADADMNSNNKSIKAEQLNWGFMDAIDYSNVADFIIGSDLTYNSGTWKILAETIATILKPKTGIFLYLTLGHSGFSSVGEVTGFVSVAEAEGLYVVKEGSKDWPFGKIPSSSGTLKGLLLEKCLRNQAERDVLAGTGGVQVLVMKRK